MGVFLMDLQPPPSNSYHEDCYMFSRESGTKPLFVTITGWGGSCLGMEVGIAEKILR